MFDADCIRVSNGVRALKPETVLFLRLVRSADKLKCCFPDIQRFIETFDETLLLKHIKFTKRQLHITTVIRWLRLPLTAKLFVVEGEFRYFSCDSCKFGNAHEARDCNRFSRR